MATPEFLAMKEAERTLLESGLTVPTPYQTVAVGTLDVATGVFTGLTTVRQQIETPHLDNANLPGGPRPPAFRVVEPDANVRSVGVGLAFQVTNYNGPLTLTVNGQTVTGQAPKIVANVGRAQRVEWSLTAGGRTVSDAVRIKRPRLLGGGAFVIPALPVAVVYAPPTGPGNAPGTVTFAESFTFGSTLTTSFKTEESTDTPGNLPPQLKEIAGFREVSDGFATACEKIPGVGAGLKSAFQRMGEALFGKVSARIIDGEVNEQTQELTVTSGSSKSVSSTVDRIIFRTGVEVAWLADENGVYLTVIGVREKSDLTVDSLKADLASGALVGANSRLPRGVVSSLLALDPFVAGGPDVNLAAVTDQLGQRRYFPLDAPQATSGSSANLTFTNTVKSSATVSQVKFTTEITECHKAFLAFLGLGVQEDKTVKVTTTHGQSRKTTQERTETVSFAIKLDPVTPLRFQAWYDAVFGGYLLQRQKAPTQVVTPSLGNLTPKIKLPR